MIATPAAIRSLQEKDLIFKTIYGQYGPPPNWSRPQGFISLSKIILEQQVSLASANAHFQKLNSYIPEFTPAEILRLTDDEMRSCQISRQKTKYLRELSNAIISKTIDLDSFSTLPESSIREQLIRIKGIGHWTVDIYLMFCLQATDIFPIGDIAVVSSAKHLTGAKTKEDLLERATNWKPYRSLAAYFLWHHYLSRGAQGRKQEQGAGRRAKK